MSAADFDMAFLAEVLAGKATIEAVDGRYFAPYDEIQLDLGAGTVTYRFAGKDVGGFKVSGPIPSGTTIMLTGLVGRAEINFV